MLFRMETDAEEVFLLMRREFRVSRNVRAWWFFQHIDRSVSIEKLEEILFDDSVEGTSDKKLSYTPHDAHTESSSSPDLAVVGAVPREGDSQSVCEQPENALFRIRPDTVVTFLSKYYRLVFILDLSPSLNTLDIVENQVLHAKVFDCLKGCLEGVIKRFKIPGSSKWFSPQVYVTVMAYTPFLCCPADQVLIQGCFLTAEVLPQVLDRISRSLRKFLETLAFGVRPWLRRWDLMERKRREERENEPITGNLFKTVSHSASDEEIKLFHRATSMEDAFFVDSGPLQGLELGDQISGYHPGLTPMDWNLIRMIRFGLLGVQLLPENTQASIIVITDGVVSVPNAHALQGLLTQLRSYTVSCSFVQIQPKLNSNVSSMGHVAYPELLEFLAKATFGSYIPDCPCTARFESSSVKTPEKEGELNVFHRSFLCWSFFRSSYDHKHFKQGSLWPDKRFFPNDLIRKQRLAVTLDSSLAHVLYVRLREGYTIRRVWFTRRSGNPETKRQICVELKLGWKPQVCLEYHVVAEWPPVRDKPKVEVKLWIEAPYEFQHDIFVNDGRKKFKPYRLSVLNAFNSAVETLSQADRLMIHLHSFRTEPVFYTMPDSVKKGRPVFYMSPNSGIPEITSIDLQESHAQFCAFWKPVCSLDVNIWQKWLHTHSLRVILTHDVPLSQHLHVTHAHTGRHSSVTSKQAGNVLYKALNEWASFTLMEEHSYVKFKYSEDHPSVPEFYYIIRACLRPPCVVLKIAFLGGIRGTVRNQIISDLKAKLLSLTIKQRQSGVASDSDFKGKRRNRLVKRPVHSPLPPADPVEIPACMLLQKPAEKVLVRYERVPPDFFRMVRLEEALDENHARALIVHNTLVGYLPCRRWLWSLKRPCDGGFPISNESAGYILQALVKRRLNEGFKFALGSNGIVNLVRELKVESKGRRNSSCLVQYIVFHPISAAQNRWTQRYRQSLSSNKRGSLNLTLERLRKESQCSEMPSEAESVEADLDTQLVTELWVEPQEGTFVLGDGDDWLRGCDGYRNLHEKVFEADKELIECLATFEHLSLICDEGLRRNSGSVDILSPARTEDTEKKKLDHTAISIFSCFELTSMLVHCQQATLLFSSFSYQSGSETMAACNKHLMDSLHRELRRSHDANFRPLELDSVWELITSNLMTDRETIEKNRWILRVRGRLRQPSGGFRGSFVPSLTVYVKKVSDSRLVVLFAPTNFEDVHHLSNIPGDSEVLAKIPSSSPGDSESEDEVSVEIHRSETTASSGMTCRFLTVPIILFNCYEPNLVAAVSKDSEFRFPSILEDFRNTGESVLTSLHRQISRLSDSVCDAELPTDPNRARSRSISVAVPDLVLEEVENQTSFSFPAYCALLESSVFAKAYVFGVYLALRRGLNVPEMDLNQAIDGKCEEFPLQVGLTEFLPEICKHFAAYRDGLDDGVSRRNTGNSDRSDFSVRSDDMKFEPPASFCTPTCSSDHEQVKMSFELLLGKFFKKVPCSQDFYFYSPPSENTDVQGKGECSEHCLEWTEEEKVQSSDDSDVEEESQLPDESGHVSDGIEFRKDEESESVILSGSASTLTRRSIGSRKSSLELHLSDEALSQTEYEEDDPDSRAGISPIFLQITCSARVFPELYTCEVDTLPTCLADVFRKSHFDSWDRDLRSVELEMTLHIFSLYPMDEAIDLIQGQLRSESDMSPMTSPTKSDNYRSFDQLPSPISPRAEERKSQVLFGTGPIEETERHHAMNRLLAFAEKERLVLSGIRNGINHLINEERIFALSRLSPEQVSSSVLSTVICNLREWTAVDECSGKDVPKRKDSGDSIAKTLNPGRRYPMYGEIELSFVTEEEWCLGKLLERLGKLRVGYCQLKKDGDIFYACRVSDLDSFWLEYIELHGMRPLVENAHLEGVAQCMEDAHLNFGDVAAPVVSQNVWDGTSTQGMLSPTEFNPDTKYDRTEDSSSRLDSALGCEDPDAADEEHSCHSCLAGRSQSFSGFPRKFYQQRRYLMMAATRKRNSQDPQDSSGGFQPAAAESLADLRVAGSKSSVRLSTKSGPAKTRGAIGKAGPVDRLGVGDRVFTFSVDDESSALDETSTTEFNTLGGYEPDESECQATNTDVRVDTRSAKEAFILGPEPNSEQHKQLIHDFWLILTVRNLRACVFFHERNKNLHQKLFGQVLEEVKAEIRRVNQEALLQEMWKSKKCDSLLIPESKKLSSTKKPEQLSDSGWRKDSLASSSSGIASGLFHAGAFSCPCMWHSWFSVHPRLKYGSIGNNLSRGVTALKSLLLKFAVRNRENVFVFKESATERVFYMRLHDSLHSTKDLFSNTEEESIDSSLPPAKQFENSVLLAVHGVYYPTEEITTELRDALQHRLDDAVLAVLSGSHGTLTRNPNCKLTSEDVEFLQPKNSKPKRLLQFTLPPVAIKHLFAVSFYLRQNLLEFMSSPNYMTNTPSGQTAPTHRFQYYGLKGSLSEETLNYDTRFYLYNRAHSAGGRGLACVCQSFVDSLGNAVGLIHSDPIDLEGYSSFFAGPEAVYGTLWRETDLDSLTRTHLIEILPEQGTEQRNKSLRRKIQGPPALIQFGIWERGEIAVEKLEEKLETAVKMALADLATEYGLLMANVYKPVANRNSMEFLSPQHEIRSEPGSPRKNSKDNLTEAERSEGGQLDGQKETLKRTDRAETPDYAKLNLRKRHSSAAIQPASAGGMAALRRQHEAPQVSARRRNIFNFDVLQAYIQKATSDSPSSATPARRKHSSGDNTIKRCATADKQQLKQYSSMRTNSVAAESLGAARMAVSATAIVRQTPTKVQLNPVYMWTAPKWFEHVIGMKKGGAVRDAKRDMGSVVKMEFGLEVCASSSLRSVLYEGVVGLKKLLVNTELTCFEAKKDKLSHGGVLYELINPHSLVGEAFVQKDTQDTVENKITSYVVVGHSFRLWKETLDYGRNWSGLELPIIFKELNPDQGPKTQNFLPLKPDFGCGFVPRQRLLLIFAKAEEITVYGYNWTPEVSQMIRNLFLRLICWFNARARLMRQICLQKMGLTHLGRISESDRKANPFLNIFWTEPDSFVRLTSPPQQINYSNRFQNLDPIFRQLLTPWRYSDELCKALPSTEFDVFTEQGLQLVDIRNRLRKVLDEQVMLSRVYSRWRNQQTPHSVIEESCLKLLVDRSRLVHNVLTPLLFSPIWRQKVAQIRRPMSTAHSEPVLHLPALGAALDASAKSMTSSAPTTVGLRKTQSIVNATVVASPARSRHSSGNAAAGAQQRPQGPPFSPQTLHKAAMTLVDSADMWHFQLQHILAKEYVKYLKHLGMIFVEVFSDSEAETESHVPTEHKRRDPFAFDPFGPPSSPEVWMQKTFNSGVVMVKLSFEEPYFIVRIYVWEAQQLPEDLLLNVNESDFQDLVDMNKFWSMLVVRSHVNSFSYDFHLKMVAAYLTGGRQVMFRPGYHMNAFLVDFLQYYACRPPSARNCIYEERLNLTNLLVEGQALHNHILNYNKAYNLTVVRMRIPSASGSTQADSDYLLVSTEDYSSQDSGKYQILRVVLQDDRPLSEKIGNVLRLKFYVIFVSQEEPAFPLEVAELDSRTLTDRSSESSSETLTPGSVGCHPGFLQRVEQGGRTLSVAPEDEEEQDEVDEDRLCYSPSATVPPLGQRVGGRRRASDSTASSPDKRGEVGIDVATREVVSMPVSPCVVRRRAQSSGEGWEIVHEEEAAPTRKVNRFEVQRVLDSQHNGNELYSSTPSKTVNLSLSLLGGRGKESPKGRRQKLSIQRSAPRRHRKSASKSETGVSPQRQHVPLGSVLAREEVTYVTYVSEPQRKLQLALEKETGRYKETLKTVVGLEASWHCRRDQLWTKLLTVPGDAASPHGQSTTHKKRSTDSTGSGEVPALLGNLSCSLSFQELEALLKFVQVIPVEEIDPTLTPFVRDLSRSWTTSLMKSLVIKYGHERCRFFAGKVSSNSHSGSGGGLRHYLIVTNPNFLDTFALIQTGSQDTVVALVYKDYESLISERHAVKMNCIQLFMEGIVSTLAYHFWSKLIG